MLQRRAYIVLGLVVLLAAAVSAAYLTRDAWRPLLGTNQPAAPAGDDHHGHTHEAERVKLSAQAQGNLRLDVRRVQLQDYWRSASMPGVIIDRPGVSDRNVTAPVVGVVTSVAAHPGDTLRPGEPLLTLRLAGESMQNAQTELFKTVRERSLIKEQRDRLEKVAGQSVAESKLIDLDQQLSRLMAIEQAYRQDLQARGLSSEQIAGVAGGKFVREVVLVAPPLPPGADKRLYEVQELKVNIGEQVQAGQLLSVLSDHQELLVEGRAFRQEAPLLETAARSGWAVRVEFTEDDPTSWPTIDTNLTIRHLGNMIDPVSRTFAFYLPLTNQSRRYVRDGQTFLAWRFRPGQRVRLHVPVEKIDSVFVLPAGAVVHEGPDAYVFVRNGDYFERKAVQVLREDRLNVVLANDGSISPGLFVAHNAAAALNRALKIQAAGHDEHDHHGHDHGHDH